MGGEGGGGRTTPTLTDGYMTRDEYIRLCVRIAQALSPSPHYGDSGETLDAAAIAATVATAAKEWADDVGGEDARAYYPTFYASVVGLARMWCASNLGEAASFLNNLNEALQPLHTLELQSVAAPAADVVTAATVPVPVPEEDGRGAKVGENGVESMDMDEKHVDGARRSPAEAPPPSSSFPQPPPPEELSSSRPHSGRKSSVVTPETIPEEEDAAPTHSLPPLTAHRPAPLIVGSPSDRMTPVGAPGPDVENMGGGSGGGGGGGGDNDQQHSLSDPNEAGIGAVTGGDEKLGGAANDVGSNYARTKLTPQWTDTQSAAEEKYVTRVGVQSSARYYSAMAQQSHAASDDRWILDEHSSQYRRSPGGNVGAEEAFLQDERKEQVDAERQRGDDDGGGLYRSPRRPKSRTVAGGRMYLSGTGPRFAYPSLGDDEFEGGVHMSGLTLGSKEGTTGGGKGTDGRRQRPN